MGLSDACFDFLDDIETDPSRFEMALSTLEEALGFYSDSPIYPQAMLDATNGVICAAKAGKLDATTIKGPLNHSQTGAVELPLAEQRAKAAAEGWIFVEPVTCVPRPRTLEEVVLSVMGSARPIGEDGKKFSIQMLTELLPKIEAATPADEDIKAGLLSLVKQTLAGQLEHEFLAQRAKALYDLLQEYAALEAKKQALLAGTRAA